MKRGSLQWIAIAIGAALVVLGVARTLSDTPTQTLSLVNDTEFEVSIDVRSAGAGGWTLLVTLEPDGKATVDEVADQGATWEFRFSSADVSAGTSQMTRDELRADGWVVEVPEQAADRLKARDVPAAPRG